MASYTLDLSSTFPETTSVSAYLAANWPTGTKPPQAGTSPVGSIVETQTVTLGVVTFTTLAANTTYYVGGQVSAAYRWVRFHAPPASSTTVSLAPSSTVTLSPASPTTTAATEANVAGSASSVTVFASNAAARSRKVWNDSTATLYLKFGTTASTTSYTVQLAPGSYYEFPSPVFTGRVDGIWSAANGNARTTEET